MANGDVGKAGKEVPNEIARHRVAATIVKYAVSREECDSIHKHIRARQPGLAAVIQRYRQLTSVDDTQTVSSARLSLRLFLGTFSALQSWTLVKERLIARGARTSRSPIKYPNLRLSISLSALFFLHRLIYRFLQRLRCNLLSKEGAPFRRRRRRISRLLTSRLAPAIGASLAGFALAVSPADQLRLSVTIYILTRAAEFTYNVLESDGWLDKRPPWWGSWMLTPLATGQLLHAFVFDRDCVPPAYTNFIIDHTPNYIQRRPLDYPEQLKWPSIHAIVDGLKEMSLLSWPPYISPTLFPGITQPLPPSLTPLSPITSPAHPAHTALSCATLHPSDPSCIRTSATYFLSAFPLFAKFFAAFYTIFSIPRYKKLLNGPTSELIRLAKRVIRTSIFVTGAIGTSWASICWFQNTVSRSFMPQSRWLLGGALGGLWAYVDRENGRGQVLYSLRASIDSLWKVGKKRGWWKGVRGGDVVLFVLSLAMINAIHERRPEAVDRSIGKGLDWIKGERVLTRPKGKGKDDGGKRD